MTSAEQALSARGDLEKYRQNRRMLFVLQMRLSVEDIDSVAERAIVDQTNDKKCDLVYVDVDSGKVIIGQAYEAESTRPTAKANKASTLNTAISWILQGDLDKMPRSLALAAEEVRNALKEKGSISSLELWYVHNCLESDGVQQELDTAQGTARNLLRGGYDAASIDVTAKEYGVANLEALYKSTQAAVLVDDALTVEVGECFVETGDQWTAICTSIPASWLHDRYVEFGQDLFSANVRGYLGSRRSDRNINHNIKETAQKSPERFWVYNNGLTALVNDFNLNGNQLSLSGIAIVNGAQTTGAIGSSTKEHLDQARVLARFVKCSDPAVIREITRYNNSQNKVEAADFRSNDAIQDRLRKEFQKRGGVEYSGARRGGAEDIIRRPGENMIPSSSAAQALVAFHGEPDLAYNQKSRIWEIDEIYGRYFNESTSSGHMLFTYSLLKAVEAIKREQASYEGERTQEDQDAFDFFSHRGSTYLLISALGTTLETYLNKPVSDKFSVKFKEEVGLTQAIALWRPLVLPAVALNSTLGGALERNLRTKDKVAEAHRNFAALFRATASHNSAIYSDFASNVISR